MEAYNSLNETGKFARCIEISKRVRWDIDGDVIRGREFDYAKKFLPDSISRVNRFDFLTSEEQGFLSQVQGRTYASMFGLWSASLSQRFWTFPADTG